jgi:DNA-binding NarL/FixJ family response regulator
MITLALADDHSIMRSGLAALLSDMGFSILFEADNGEDFIKKISSVGLPDVALLDINMPVMDGYATAQWLKQNHPQVGVLALSMINDEVGVLRMIQNGAKGYVLKDSSLAELKKAINEIHTKGYYHSEFVSYKLIQSLNNDQVVQKKKPDDLTERELEFLKLACTEFTYKEIADRMHVSNRTVEGYRDAICEKLELKSRVGLALYAIKKGLVKV